MVDVRIESRMKRDDGFFIIIDEDCKVGELLNNVRLLLVLEDLERWVRVVFVRYL